MKKLSEITISVFLSFLCLIPLVLPFQSPIFSGEIDDLEDEIEEKQDEIEENESLLEEIEARISEISNSKYSLSEKISLLGEEVSEMGDMIDAKEIEIDTKLKEIDAKEKLLAEKQALLGVVSGELYVESRFGFYNFLFSGKGLDDFFESLYIRKSAISILADEIEEISGEFSNLAEARTNLEDEKEELDEEKEILDESYALLEAERSKLQAELNAEYAQRNAVKRTIGGITFKITELQQTILYLKGGGGLTNADAVSSNATPTTQLKYFRDNAPVGTFGIFSFGASTHRNGMSQYGALERAQQGQSYEDILKDYYPGITLDKNYSEPVNIKILGWGENCGGADKYYNETIAFSTYMNRIYEMSPSWDIEAVKAQTVASRSYAIAYTSSGGSIPPSQSGQVYKDCNNTSTWMNIVNATKNQVLVSGGTAYKAFFAAVHGGWSNTLNAYDVVAGSEEWYTRAWEARSGVNWFYMNWYQRKTKDGYVSCSTKPNPWLSGEELADILNAYKYWMSLGTSNIDINPRLVPIDAQQCWGDRANPYSWSEMKGKVDNPIKKVLSATTTNSNGWTTGLQFAIKLESGATSTFTISGTTTNGTLKTLAFRDIFNLRAPAYFSIPQVGGGSANFIHINIETGVK